jgi:membrane-anchored protein YejM (alkaline phosphatase superfamily)
LSVVVVVVAVVDGTFSTIQWERKKRAIKWRRGERERNVKEGASDR